MTDVLSTDAPVVEPAVAPVAAPVPDATVDAGSAGVGAVVPAERFNGLMAKYQSEKTEWETREAAIRSEIETLRKPSQEPVVGDNPELQQLIEQNQELVRLVTEERAANARNTSLSKALEEYPEAKPFADLIVGSNESEILGVAQLIAERAKAAGFVQAPDAVATTEPAAATTTTEPATPVAPPFAGAVGVSGEEVLDDIATQALANNDFIGFAKARLSAQALEQNAEVS